MLWREAAGSWCSGLSLSLLLSTLMQTMQTTVLFFDVGFFVYPGHGTTENEVHETVVCGDGIIWLYHDANDYKAELVKDAVRVLDKIDCVLTVEGGLQNLSTTSFEEMYRAIYNLGLTFRELAIEAAMAKIRAISGLHWRHIHYRAWMSAFSDVCLSLQDRLPRRLMTHRLFADCPSFEFDVREYAAEQVTNQASEHFRRKKMKSALMKLYFRAARKAMKPGESGAKRALIEFENSFVKKCKAP